MARAAWLRDKVVAYLRALPKEQRRALVPLPDAATRRACRDGRAAGRQALSIALAEALRAVRRVEIAPSGVRRAHAAGALALRVAVVDAEGRVLAASRDLTALQRELGARARERRCGRGCAAPAGFKRSDLARWDFGDLPESVVVAQRPQAT